MYKRFLVFLWLSGSISLLHGQTRFFHLTDSVLQPNTRLYTYNIRFMLGKSEIDTSQTAFLDSLYTFFKIHPQAHADIIVHSDSRTCASEMKTSRKLFQSRAEAIVGYLLQMGIEPGRLTPKGYGCRQLLISDVTISKLTTKEEVEAAHRVNRRVEIYITQR